MELDIRVAQILYLNKQKRVSMWHFHLQQIETRQDWKYMYCSQGTFLAQNLCNLNNSRTDNIYRV